MKNIKIISSAIFISAILFSHRTFFAQQAPEIEWQYRYGGTSMDYGYSIIQAQGNIADNYVFAGSAILSDGDLAGCNPIGFKGWIVSMDGAGAILWQECLGDSKATFAETYTNRIIRTSDGGYAVCGETSSLEGFFFGNHGGEYDAFVAKLDSNGNTLWVKCFGGSGWDVGVSIIETKDEGRDLVIVGVTNSKDGDVSGWHIDTSENKWSDIWVVRMSSEGKIRWQKCLGGTGQDGTNGGSPIIQTKDGGFVISGTTTSNDGDVTGNHLDSNKHPSQDFWIIKLDPKGTIQWQKCFGGSGADEVSETIETSEGGYAAVGRTSSMDGDVIGLHKPFDQFNESDIWVIKFDSFGSLQWQKCFGGGLEESGSSIVQIPNGSFIIAGLTSSNNGDVSGNHGESDAWIVRLNDKGAIQWQKCYGGSGQEVASCLIKTSNGGYAFVGSTNSIDGDLLFSNYHGDYDIWVVKLEPDTITASVPPSYSSDFVHNNVKIYPNPSQVDVHFSVNSIFSLSGAGFYDMLGRQYFPKYSLENNLLSCDIHDFPSGIYLARLGWTSGMTWRDGVYPGSFTLPFLVQH